MNTLADIESLTKKFSDAHADLSQVVTELNEQVEAFKRAALPGIKRAVARAAERKAELAAAVDASHDLFVRPRTVIFHGIKVGLRKGTGGLDWDDEDRTLALIEKRFGEEANAYVKTTKKPLTKALQELDVVTLKKLGITVEDTGDLVVIAPTDSAVDKIVKALLADATDQAIAEAA